MNNIKQYMKLTYTLVIYLFDLYFKKCPSFYILCLQ